MERKDSFRRKYWERSSKQNSWYWDVTPYMHAIAQVVTSTYLSDLPFRSKRNIVQRYSRGMEGSSTLPLTSRLHCILKTWKRARCMVLLRIITALRWMFLLMDDRSLEIARDEGRPLFKSVLLFVSPGR
jgi:hypothetical protein